MAMTDKEKNDAAAVHKSDDLAKAGVNKAAKERRKASHCSEGAAELGLCTPIKPSRQDNPPQYGPSGQNNDDENYD